MCDDHRIDSFGWEILEFFERGAERRIVSVLEVQPTPRPITPGMLSDVLDRLRHPFSLLSETNDPRGGEDK